MLKQADGVEGAQAPGSAFYFMGNGGDQYYSTPREYAATFSLPAGLSCDGASAKCVLQMYYVTGEFGGVLGRPVGAEDALETNQPTDQPLTNFRPLPKIIGNTCSPPFIPSEFRDASLPECGTGGAGYPEVSAAAPLVDQSQQKTIDK